MPLASPTFPFCVARPWLTPTLAVRMTPEPILREAGAIATALANPLLQTIVAFSRSIAVLDRDPEQAVDLAEYSLRLAASIRATWFETASTNYLTATLARVGDVEEAVRRTGETLDRLLHGATPQSAANTLRNTIVVLDRLGVPDRAAPVGGWLEQNRPAIPATPGMRNHPSIVADRLRCDLGLGRANELIESGSLLSLQQIAAIARREVASAASS